WIPGLDADFVVAVPDEETLFAYRHLPNVFAVVDDDPRQLAELALRGPAAVAELNQAPPPPPARLEPPDYDYRAYERPAPEPPAPPRSWARRWTPSATPPRWSTPTSATRTPGAAWRSTASRPPCATSSAASCRAWSRRRRRSPRPRPWPSTPRPATPGTATRP